MTTLCIFLIIVIAVLILMLLGALIYDIEKDKTIKELKEEISDLIVRNDQLKNSCEAEKHAHAATNDYCQNIIKRNQITKDKLVHHIEQILVILNDGNRVQLNWTPGGQGSPYEEWHQDEQGPQR